ncbi:MAG: N-6 DNA methylase [Candidatus Lokiarchaeota archaeon]|nr:N-6 DNA methylase [Candidatus Lokiarchaeota archaeon]
MARINTKLRKFMSNDSFNLIISDLVEQANQLRKALIHILKTEDNQKQIFERIWNKFLSDYDCIENQSNYMEIYADILTQSAVFGLFLIWLKKNNKHNVNYSSIFPQKTYFYILFQWIETEAPQSIQDRISSIFNEVLNKLDIETRADKDWDIILDNKFYDSFLWHYQPRLAKQKGIVYTPEPVITFIINSIHHLLSKKLGINEGIYSEKVNILDPATGIMGFPCQIIKFFHSLSKQKQIQMKKDLQNIFAFEILPVPYLFGILRTTLLLERYGVLSINYDNQPHFYLCNALTKIKDVGEVGENNFRKLIFNNDVLVVLGNPPYNVSSQNKIDWIEQKINYSPNLTLESESEITELKKKANDYFWDLQRNGTKKISGYKAIQDDYVKFIRYAQYLVKENSTGIVAFVTNNYYIDGLIFRGMRSSLRKTFDEIWIVDLNGDIRKPVPKNLKKRGITQDENIFDITSGIAISFFIRYKDHSDSHCKIYYASFWGTKIQKMQFLMKSIKEMEFVEVAKRRDYEFCPDTFGLRNKYNEFTYILDIFRKHIQGIVTGNDMFISDIDKNALKKRIKDFFDDKLTIETRSWNYETAKTKTTCDFALTNIIKWNYRGFDIRYICYDKALIVRDRFVIMQSLIPSDNGNVTLIINRQNRSDLASSFFISDTIFDHKCCEGASGLHSYAFPLKIIESNKEIPNINNKFKNILPYSEQISDKELFFYIYAILYAPTYRKRYYHGLMSDFPRIPFPSDLEYFYQMSMLGRMLANLHLLNPKYLNIDEFEISESKDLSIYSVKRKDVDKNGNSIIDTYDPYTQKIYFNKRTKQQLNQEKMHGTLNQVMWIGGISRKMWKFEIGGKQQLRQWLYARRYSNIRKRNTISRPITEEELTRFLEICSAIKKTIELLPKIDEIYLNIDK